MTIALAILALLVVLPVAGLVAFTALVARHAGKLVPPCGRFLTVDGVRLHYLDEGSGPTVVMIHGLASQLQTYTYSLQARLQGRYRLIMLDRPGSGYSQPGTRASLSAQASIVAAFLRELGIGRALVVGHSLGGAVALALALDHPERVAGLALISPATQPQGEPPKALSSLAVRSDPMRRLLGWTIAVPLGIRTQAATLTMLFSPDPAPADFATRGGALLVARPATYRNACRDLVEAGGELPALARRYGTLKVPVGVLYGTGDRILSHELHGSRLREQIEGVDVELIDGGHMIPLTAPESSAAFIDRMAERAGLRQRAPVAAH